MKHHKSLVTLIISVFMNSIYSDDIVTVFAHGLGGNKDQGSYYQAQHEANGFIQGTLATFNFKDYKNPRQSCLGQEIDIQFLDKEAQKYAQTILVGVSRGSATIINYLGTQKPHNVVAAILESPFDSILTIVQHLKETGSPINLSPSLYPKFNPNGLHPIDVVQNIAQDIPLLFIASKHDALIPESSIMKLYKKLKDAGHKKVHILVLDRGDHANILWGPDGCEYRNAVHAFYKKYGLPHNEAWALAGKNLI